MIRKKSFSKRVLAQWFLSFTCLFLLPGISVPKSCSEQADLKFAIVLEKTVCKGQDPINATFKLMNKGAEPVWVNKRFHIDPAGASPDHRGEVTLKATSPSGKELTCKFSYELGLPKSDYFELLQPGKEVASEYPRNLRGCFDFSEEGDYRVMAVYENFFGKEIGLEVFRGRLTSETVIVKTTKQ